MLIRFKWDESKNNILQKTRGISFDDIVDIIYQDKVLEIEPNKKYRDQNNMYVYIEFKKYVYIVPYEKRGDHIWLITEYSHR